MKLFNWLIPMVKKALILALAVLMLPVSAFALRITATPIVKYPGRKWSMMYSTQLDKRRANDYVNMLVNCLGESFETKSDYKEINQLRVFINEYAAAVSDTPMVGTEDDEKLPTEILALVPYVKTRSLITRNEMFKTRDIFRAVEAAASSSGDPITYSGEKLGYIREFIENQMDVLLAQTAAPEIYLVFYKQVEKVTNPLIRLKLLIVLERALSWEGGRKQNTIASFVAGKTGMKYPRLPKDKPVSLEPVDTIVGLGLHKSKDKATAYWAMRVLTLFDSPKVWTLVAQNLDTNFQDETIRRAIVLGLTKNYNAPAAGRVLAGMMKKLHEKSTGSKTEIERGVWLSEIGAVASAMVQIAPRVFNDGAKVQSVQSAYESYFKKPQIKLSELYKGIRSFIVMFSQTPDGKTS